MPSLRPNSSPERPPSAKSALSLPKGPDARVGIRYDQMSRPVRSYVDNLKAQVKELMAKSGSTNIEELEVHANAGKVRLEDLRKIRDLTQALLRVVRTGEAPPGYVSPEVRALMERESTVLEAFFEKPINVPPLPAEITPDRLANWEKLGMELHYFPAEDMTKDRKLKAWKRPNNWFYERIAGRTLPGSATRLPEGWFVVDGRQKPAFVADGSQMYDQDPLAPVLRDLNRRGLITQTTFDGATILDAASRFGLSPADFDKPEVMEALAKALDLDPNQISLPETIVWNVLANIHHPEWGTTNTSEWRAEKYGSGSRLCSGGSDSGGASRVRWRGRAYERVGFRPLGRFS